MKNLNEIKVLNGNSKIEVTEHGEFYLIINNHNKVWLCNSQGMDFNFSDYINDNHSVKERESAEYEIGETVKYTIWINKDFANQFDLGNITTGYFEEIIS